MMNLNYGFQWIYKIPTLVRNQVRYTILSRCGSRSQKWQKIIVLYIFVYIKLFPWTNLNLCVLLLMCSCKIWWRWGLCVCVCCCLQMSDRNCKQLDLRKLILPEVTGLYSHSRVYHLKEISLLFIISFSCCHLLSVLSSLYFNHVFLSLFLVTALHPFPSLCLSNKAQWGESICSISSWSLAEGNETLPISCFYISAQHNHAQDSR